MKNEMTNEEYTEKLSKIVDGIDSAEMERPQTAPIIAMFLDKYRPHIGPERSALNMTSTEIVNALDDICQCTTTDVAVVMAYMGYKLVVNEYRGMEWAMQAIE